MSSGSMWNQVQAVTSIECVVWGGYAMGCVFVSALWEGQLDHVVAVRNEEPRRVCVCCCQ